MAKKQKRSVSSSVAEKQPQAQTFAAPQTPNTSLRRPAVSMEFNPDYTPIISDLKRIGILAVSFIGILVVLSFFLR